MIDVDVPIGWAVYTRLVDADQPRIIKQFGDIGLEPRSGRFGGRHHGDPAYHGWHGNGAPTVIGTGSSGRRTAILDVPGGSILSQNLGIQISGVLEETDTDRPRLFWWEPNFIPKTDDNQARTPATGTISATQARSSSKASLSEPTPTAWPNRSWWSAQTLPARRR